MYRISMRLLVSLFGVLAISGAGLGAVLINEVELNPPAMQLSGWSFTTAERKWLT